MKKAIEIGRYREFNFAKGRSNKCQVNQIKNQ